MTSFITCGVTGDSLLADCGDLSCPSVIAGTTWKTHNLLNTCLYLRQLVATCQCKLVFSTFAGSGRQQRWDLISTDSSKSTERWQKCKYCILSIDSEILLLTKFGRFIFVTFGISPRQRPIYSIENIKFVYR